ncbi:MAG: ADP-ribosyl-(dinitrogen reductase) hydrolase [Lysobacterales bacterium CG02_land_8_20_14_3_00_62_12]|nr:MAG: ADP-ribosyl-(dinitrogen reductase) hydrolase [Xanthomonadales bacterium CG02_land_8_20_14_3_00_62_12]
MIIPEPILAKIGTASHGNVSRREVEECFFNNAGRYATDTRPEHRSHGGSPTYWFVAETNHRRLLKIMFVRDGQDIHLKSAYPAAVHVAELFNRKTK